MRGLGIKYSNIPSTYFDGWQHIRRADEVISSLSANCLDGTLFFASVMELLGLEPVLVFRTGHAYVGVNVGPGSNQVWFVETTLVGVTQTTFWEAYLAGLDSAINDQANDPLFRMVDVKEMHSRNILPLPQ